MIHDQSRLRLVSTIYVTSPITGRQSKPTYVDIRQRVTEFAQDDRIATIDSAHHWSHYGLQYLGDARNWWIIADLSNVVDPFTELTVGDNVRIPSLQRYLFQVLAEGT
jgi:hypothetical protein